MTLRCVGPWLFVSVLDLDDLDHLDLIVTEVDPLLS